jgi:NDP-sugar pyrophosphorylase family protein
VADAMNSAPRTAPVGSSDRALLAIMREAKIAAVPLVDVDGRFVSLVHLSDLAPDEPEADRASFAFAVVMAGGEGQRLRPITEKIPKPMVDIGGAPLLERLVRRLAKAGVTRIYLAVNYLGEVIERHFGDGSAFGIDIRYLREKEKLGTGGALRLLPEVPGGPILVMNGDILTNSNFASLHAFHVSHHADVTVAAIDYHINIPFGVIENRGHQLVGLTEKPSQHFLCNAGIYVLSPEALGLVAGDGPVNMTDLVARCVATQRQVAVFPVHEYWSDIGTADDLDNARRVFARQ